MSASRRPLHLLLVADSLDVGGAERHVVGLASALASRGAVVMVACSVEGALSAACTQAGIPVRPLMRHLVKRRLSLVYAWRLARLVRRERFDLVHAHMYASALASALATLHSGIPMVLTEHSEASWRTRSARRHSRWAYGRASRVIAVSQSIRQRLIEQDRVPGQRVTVIHNGLPALPALPALPTLPTPELPHPAPQLVTELRGRPVVGIIARLQPEKGVAYFLEAAARIAQVLPAARFVVVGDGPQRDALHQLSVRLGIGDQVHFLGFRLDVPVCMDLLDVLVVSSLSEGTPLVVLEAMAAGVPVVASAVGGLPEQIRDGCDGVLVGPADAEALSEAVLSLLRDPVQAHRLGLAGQQRIAEQFRYDTMVRQTEAVYHAALGWPVAEATSFQAPTAR